MTVASPEAARARQPAGMTRLGYSLAIAINTILLVVVNNLLEWGFLPFLISDFEQVLPLINLSLGFGILLNLIYLSFDPAWFKSLSQMVSGLISLAVAIQMFVVFPFDFTIYEFNWAPWARLVLILGIVGAAVAVIVEMVRLARLALSSD